MAKKLDRIRKFLRLAKSTNPHEAALALAKARELMEESNLGNADPDLLEIREEAAHSRNGQPPIWMGQLALMVAGVFGVQVFHARTGWSRWEVRFVGPDSRVDLAVYSFSVLRRQLEASRREFIKTECRRFKAANKTARGDMYAAGWVSSARSSITYMAIPDPECHAMQAFTHKHHPTMGRDERSARRTGNDIHDATAYLQGLADGKGVQVHQGVGEQQRAIGRAP